MSRRPWTAGSRPPTAAARWITSPASRADAHARRARLDAIVVGTGTVLADDPSLTARPADGTVLPADRQPLRVVVGRRSLPAGPRCSTTPRRRWCWAPTTRAEVLATLSERGARRVLVEGGPVLAAAFWRAGLVDELVVYLAPVLLGGGPPAVGDLGIAAIGEAARLDVVDVVRTGRTSG